MENNTESSKNSMMSPALLGIGAIIIVALAGFLFLSKSTKNENTEKTAATTVQEESQKEAEVTPSVVEKTDDVDSANMVTVEMEAGGFYYKPNIIKAKKGQTVKIVFKSVDMMHNFNIDELNVKSATVKSGNSETFEFVAEKTGTFEYYCSVGKHRSLGQVGKLIVE